jgi:hypothetical protein
MHLPVDFLGHVCVPSTFHATRLREGLGAGLRHAIHTMVPASRNAYLEARGVDFVEVQKSFETCNQTSKGRFKTDQ